MSDTHVEKTERSRVRRLHERGRYDRETVYSILDATPLGHVGYVIDGKPTVTPTFHWREEDRVYWHGSSASRALRASEEQDVCLTVSLLDGLVLARSAFHHSANYRSAMVFGKARKIRDDDEKLARLKAFVDRLYPDRWDSLRPITAQELKATTVLSLPIEEASAKLRTGDPVDDEEDYAVPVWAGVLPIHSVVGTPIRDSRLTRELTEPAHVRGFKLA